MENLAVVQEIGEILCFFNSFIVEYISFWTPSDGYKYLQILQLVKK